MKDNERPVNRQETEKKGQIKKQCRCYIEKGRLPVIKSPESS